MKITLTDETKKNAKAKLEKHKGKEIKKMSQSELAELLEVVCQHLGIADLSGKIK